MANSKLRCFVIFILLSIAVVSAAKWPKDSTVKCSQSTKQKAMYGIMTFKPQLSPLNTFKRMQVTVRWDALQFNPENKNKVGGNYISYTTGVKNGPGGYLGAQIWNNKGAFLFSIWDADRFTGSGHSKKVKVSSKLVWPIATDTCKRNCQDCGLEELRELAKRGLTTGTKCMINYPIKIGHSYQIVLEQTQQKKTINTADYEGMGQAHIDMGETNRKVEGFVWNVAIHDLRLKVKKVVGAVLFEGNGDGMHRLGTFDEMIGCVKCNAVHHRNTRINLKLDANRYPVKMAAKTRADESTCKMYKITGSKSNYSIKFEGGPLTKDPFPKEVKNEVIWE